MTKTKKNVQRSEYCEKKQEDLEKENELILHQIEHLLLLIVVIVIVPQRTR